MHKISFIAQDMADSRAFGYIYGSPENGHRFFGIKTERAAGQVLFMLEWEAIVVHAKVGISHHGVVSSIPPSDLPTLSGVGEGEVAISIKH